jgi:hypothetical protein
METIKKFESGKCICCGDESGRDFYCSGCTKCGEYGCQKESK